MSRNSHGSGRVNESADPTRPGPRDLTRPVTSPAYRCMCVCGCGYLLFVVVLFWNMPTTRDELRYFPLINIYGHSVLGGFGQKFFPSRPQYAILGTGILGQIASFERLFRGAALTPLALPYPFRIWPGSGTWAE